MQLTAKPERTFGLIVGIEKYDEPKWNVTGGGPADDALKFACWLLGANHPNTITYRENLEYLRRNRQP